MNLDFNKFPKQLREALQSRINFPNGVLFEYEKIANLYRAIFRKFSEAPLSVDDFKSHVELGKAPADTKDIALYSCSLFNSVEVIKKKFKRAQPLSLAEGTITSSYGPILRGREHHLDLWLYEGEDPSETFKEIEI